MDSKHQYLQEPIAIVGFGCRLPGGNTNPHKLWEFLRRGGIASNKVPSNRFDIDGHWDGSLKPRTMRPLGGMFLEETDPADFDASFFEISKGEAISMDPNQHYDTMQSRDPEDRPAGVTVGVGRAILANRLSHFLNIKGPSMTIDTACSGSLIGLDVACRYLQSREINAAIIATSNLYLNPEHVMDTGAVGNAHSPSGLCHTFDVSADGYVKAEAVSAVIVKRLADAIRDGDPIRAVVRGTSTNSDGRTPGIASPSAEAQAVAIRTAYANAGITNFNDTAYLECHGTGTQQVSSYLPEHDDEFLLDDEDTGPYRVIVFSANDEASLRANIRALSDHLVNPRVKVDLADLAYTLSERRTRLFHRAFVTTNTTELNETAFTLGKKNSETPRIGFIFTGQGAQWPQMGKQLISSFPLDTIHSRRTR
ncbi:hypothetical protein N0V88_005719 [Collariella sp. IMI 366227]|nr:hypothetical protein N0V88_005719 [Collariella sp. IMI 366227]